MAISLTPDDDVFVGTEGPDDVDGGAGNDDLAGGAGDDLLNGGAGNDRFDWDPALRAGVDTFVGGTGDDEYVLGDAADVVVENAGEGMDTVWVAFAYSIAAWADVERLMAYGGAGVALGGNAGDNWLLGGVGDDNLDGADGKDLLDGAAGADTLVGGLGEDTLYGSDGSDHLDGGADQDLLCGGAGNDAIDGGDGLDEAWYGAARGASTAQRLANGDVTIGGPEGTDTLHDTERAIFTDLALGFDVDGTGGKAYRLYKAAYDRDPDPGGLGFWIFHLDGGFDFILAADNFLNSDEFRAMYGDNPTNQEFVRLLYLHVLQREPDQAGYDFWNAAMTNEGGNFGHAWTRGEVLTLFSESDENKVNVLGSIENGFEYTPWIG